TFHHLHRDLQSLPYGRVPSPPGATHPWKVPLSSPLDHPKLCLSPRYFSRLFDPDPRTGRLGLPPSVALSTLDNRDRGSMKKRANPSLPGAFFKTCCIKSTLWTRCAGAGSGAFSKD